MKESSAGTPETVVFLRHGLRHGVLRDNRKRLRHGCAGCAPLLSLHWEDPDRPTWPGGRCGMRARPTSHRSSLDKSAEAWTNSLASLAFSCKLRLLPDLTTKLGLVTKWLQLNYHCRTHHCNRYNSWYTILSSNIQQRTFFLHGEAPCSALSSRIRRSLIKSALRPLLPAMAVASPQWCAVESARHGTFNGRKITV